MICDISVIIPTMNRPDSLKRTLGYIAENSLKPAEIIVVDQSQDSNLASLNKEYTENCDDEIVSKYLYQETPSLTKARNYGIKHATKEIVVCSDDDVDVRPDTFSLINQVMKDKNIAMIAGLDTNTVLSEKSKIGYFMGTKSYKKRKIGHVTASVFGRFPVAVTDVTQTEWAMGFFFVIRRTLQSQWNLWWDEQLISYAYAEDLDFSYSYYKKAKALGMLCIYHPQIIVTHQATKEYRVPSRKSSLMYMVNREYLSYKHFGHCSRIASRWTNFWRIITAVRRPQHMKNLIEGQIKADLHRKELRKGILDPKIYD